MAWRNPIKTIRICFYESGHIIDHYMMADEHDAIDRLISLLRESNAVIVGVEELTENEIRHLRAVEGRGGRSLFAPTECYGHWEASSRQRCARSCPLRPRE